uniref:Uncharacterized protein n=1 Tax=Heterorhabditis bacteriophora TaxID=37862 RepID=A0A1I7W992_HETBA
MPSKDALTVIKEQNTDIKNALKKPLNPIGSWYHRRSRKERRRNLPIYGKIFETNKILDSIIELKDNFNIAYRRLISLLESLKNKPEQPAWDLKVLHVYLEEGITEIACENIHNRADTFCPPHRGVWKAGKATVLRLVFDASQKSRSSPFLIDCIFKGHSFINKIHELLISARWGQNSTNTIRLATEHRDLARFLWVKDPNKPLTKDNLAIYRFTLIPFGINASPSVLNTTISKRMIDIGTPLATEILKNLCVDNVMLEAECPGEHHESKKYFQKIRKNLRDLISNNSSVINRIPETDRANTGP